MTQAILAGFLIGIGDIALMSSENKVVGAFLFAVALMSIIYFQIPLFTGKIGFILKDHNYAGCIILLIFNVFGATLAVWMYTLMSPDNKLAVRGVATAKFSKGFLALFLAGVFCNVLIHLAVSTKHTVIVILCVMAFILCGFEHNIADIPYAIIGFEWSKVVSWIFVLLGNAVGAICTEFLLNFMRNDAGEKQIDDPANNVVDESPNDIVDEEFTPVTDNPSPFGGVFPGVTMPSFEDPQLTTEGGEN